MAQAIRQQLDRLAYTHTSFFTTGVAEELADRLSAAAPGGPWRVLFVSGGSEATEAALKLARQLQVERGQPSRDHFVSRHFSYHGNTLGALSVGGHIARRKLYGPILAQCPPHPAGLTRYRHQQAGETAEAYGLRMARTLADLLDQLGSDRVIAFIAETVVGATLGAVPPTPGYFRRDSLDLRSPWRADDPRRGDVRDGTLRQPLCLRADGVVPDMITLAKGLGAGYQPIGALMVNEKIASELAERLRRLPARPHLCRARGCMRRRTGGSGDHRAGGPGRAGARTGDALAAMLREPFRQPPPYWRYPWPRPDARFGAGRGSRRQAAFSRRGQTVGPRQVDGYGGRADLAIQAGCRRRTNGDHVLIAPPYTISAGEIEELVRRLDRALARALTEIGTEPSPLADSLSSWWCMVRSPSAPCS